MELVPVEGTCLSPLQYHSVQAARGTKTASFIGDLALTYALLQRTGKIDETRLQREKADYTELKGSPYLSTVFFPVDVNYLPPLTRNTLLGIDTIGTNEEPTAATGSGSSMYSNFFFTQAIAPGSIFRGYIFTEQDIELPPTIRVGNQLQCLLQLKTMPQEDIGPGWANLYTLQYVVGRDSVHLKEDMELYDALHQYRIVKNVPRNTLEEWYQPFWTK